MKKLLIAVSAAACALGAFAEDAAAFTQSGTSFEDLPTGPFSTAVDDNNVAIGSSTLGQFWYTAAEADGIEAKVTAYAEGAAPTKDRPAQWATKSNANYLNIESTSKPLYRTVTTNSAAIPAGKTGVYIDTMVQFTAGDPTMSADDDQAKLAIWVCGNTEDGDPDTATNFVVRAGQFVNGTHTTTNYVMKAVNANGSDANLVFNAGDWYRLTVKTIENVGEVNGLNYAGYVVFVDEKMLVPASGAPAPGVTAYTGAYAAGVLPSMVNDDTTIAAVGFSGTGAIDDISFTTTAPDFAADAENYLVDIGEGVTLKFGETTLVDDNRYAAGADLTFTATAASGFLVWYTNDVEVVRNVGTWTGTLAKDDVLQVVARTQNCLVGDVPYEFLADAFAKAASGSTIKLTGAVTLEGILEIDDGETFTLDLNGQTLTGGDVAVIDNSGSLTIVDSSADQTGRVVPAAGEDNWAVTATYGTLTINAGAYEGDIVSNGGSVVINGGKFLNVNEYDVETWSGSYTIGTDLTVTLNVDGYFVVGAEAEPTVITITFVNGETSTSVDADADGNVTAPVDPTEEGKVFVGWYNADDVKFDASTVFTGNATFTAKWANAAAAEDGDATYADEASADAVAANGTQAPDGVTGDAATTYKSYFTATKGTSEVDGKTVYTVSFALTAAGEAAVKEAMAESAASIPVANVAAGTATTTDITGATPGFYYSVEVADNLSFTSSAEGARQLATGTTVSGLQIPTVTSDAKARFFRVKANVRGN